MESQFLENNKKNSLVSILIIVSIILILMLIVYSFFAIQKVSKETRYVGLANNQNNTINVSETGTVYATADMATVTFTTFSQNANISEALKTDNSSTNSILDFLKQQSINDSDIKTVDFNIYPQYQWQTKGVNLSIYPLGKKVITGYQVTHSIQVNIKNIDQAGNIIQGAVVAGASQVSDLTLTNSKLEDLKSQARELAIKQAKSKAISIASGMGVALGNPISFTESFINPIPFQAATIGSGSSLQIAVGQNKIEVTVNISYEIK